MAIALIVGLGNPGNEYEHTRHNAGAWYVRRLAERHAATLVTDQKYHGLTGRISLHGRDVRLLIPTTFMNRSGTATAALARFYRIEPEQMLVAHDELDLPPGTVRLKQGGGHGGHNGLRDIIQCHGNSADFVRLRIGIGRPAAPGDVTPWVLGRPPAEDRTKIEAAIDAAIEESAVIVAGDLSRAMNKLNGFTAPGTA